MGETELHERIRQSMKRHASSLRRPISPQEYGEMIGEEECRPPYSSADVQSWINGSNAPPFSALMAIGRLAGLRGDDEQLCNLAFGQDAAKRELTEDEYRRVHGHMIAALKL